MPFKRKAVEGASKRYHQLPEDIAKRTDLSLAAKVAYAVVENLAQLGLDRWPGLRRIAVEMGVDPKTAERAVRELSAHGVVSWNGKGERFTRRYELGPSAPRKMVERRPPSVPSPGTEPVPYSGAEPVPGEGTDAPPPYNPPMKETGKEKIETTEDGLLIPTSQFLERLRKEKRIRPSPKEALYFDTLVGMGVSPAMLWDLTLKLWLELKPWEFRSKVLARWATWKSSARRIRAYHVGHRGVRPAESEIAGLHRYGTPAWVAWALGERAADDSRGQSGGQG